MPWLETAPMQQRERFLGDHRRALLSMTELCARYGISRKTGYKWLKRYEEGGRPALADRSHTPLHCPHRIDPAMEELLCAAGSCPMKSIGGLQTELIARPHAGAIVPGGGGIRKVRWAVQGRGKSGGVRVIYYWATAYDTILMLLVYPKNEQDNLTDEQTRALSTLVKKEYR